MRLTPKRKDKKIILNIQRKKTTIKTHRNKNKKRKTSKKTSAAATTTMMMNVKTQQSKALSIIVLKHMAEADTKRRLAPPIISIEIYGIQRAMIAPGRRTKPKRLSFCIQRRASECDGWHRTNEPMPDTSVSGCATATAITKRLLVDGAQDKDRVVFMRFAVSFSVSYFCGAFSVSSNDVLGFGRNSMCCAEVLTGEFLALKLVKLIHLISRKIISFSRFHSSGE